MKIHTCLCLALLAAGCGARSGRPLAREVGDSLAVTVLADSAETASLPPARTDFARAGARLTLVRIAAARADVAAALRRSGADAELVRTVEEVAVTTGEEEQRIFGESLPPGLRLVEDAAAEEPAAPG